MRRNLFVAAVFLQIVVLVAWAVNLERALAGAVIIRLEVVPVDPRDLLRGDYVWLCNRLSTLTSELFTPRPSGHHGGDTVYVAVAPRGNVWDAASASLSRETLVRGPGERLLVGRIEWSSSPNVLVTYGIERYYVPEGKGTPPRGRMEAEVALTADGRAFLRQLFFDGQPYP